MTEERLKEYEDYLYSMPIGMKRTIGFSLLDEIRRLQQQVKDYEGCKGIEEDYYNVLLECRYHQQEVMRMKEKLDELEESK